MIKDFQRIAVAALGAAALTAGLAGGAHAQQDQAGYYVGVSAGYNAPEDSDIEGNNFTASADIDDALLSFGSIALGYAYEGPWRGEVELARRVNDVDSVSGIQATGDVSANSLMFNAFYDFHDLIPRVTPYVGAGLGVAHVEVDGASPINGVASSSSDNVLAGQLMAGAAIRLIDDLDLTGQYTFFGTDDPNLTLNNGQAYDAEYHAHTFSIGLRFNFPEPKPAPEPAPEPVAEPAPQPEPAPAPEPEPEIVRNFIVFFDWDSAAVTPEAMDVLREAVGYAEQGNVARIVLTGHADTSGAATYNMGLSQRRAEAVRTEVVGLGYNGGIETVARGETDPLVETGDGVREPQNRRVEIMLD